MPNNYELSSFIISETPYLLFTSAFIYFLDRKNYKITFVLGVFGFFVRQSGWLIYSFFTYLYF